MLAHSLRMRAAPGIRPAPPPRHGPRGINHLAAYHLQGRRRLGAGGPDVDERALCPLRRSAKRSDETVDVVDAGAHRTERLRRRREVGAREVQWRSIAALGFLLDPDQAQAGVVDNDDDD